MLVLAGIKATNRMQQLHDFNTVCYEKVIQQVRNGHQVSSTNEPRFFYHIRNLNLGVQKVGVVYVQ